MFLNHQWNNLILSPAKAIDKPMFQEDAYGFVYIQRMVAHSWGFTKPHFWNGAQEYTLSGQIWIKTLKSWKADVCFAHRIVFAFKFVLFQKENEISKSLPKWRMYTFNI